LQQQEYGPRRSRETKKPRVACPEPAFYQCGECGNIIQAYALNSSSVPDCCGERMEPAEIKDPSGISEELLLDYRITGGYNDNAVQVFWEKRSGDAAVEWIYLRTFSGGQIKYVSKESKTSFVFALADEDSYSYCDEDPCLECTFRCKRGFEIYAKIKEKGLFKIPLERMRASWDSQH
jgi:hypothetical protein